MSDMEEITPQEAGRRSREPGNYNIESPVFMFRTGINAKEIRLNTGEHWGVDLTGIKFRELLLYYLWQFYGGKDLEPGLREEIRTTFGFIRDNLYELDIKFKSDKLKEVEATYRYNQEIGEDEIQRRLNNPIVMFITAKITGKENEFLAIHGGEPIKLHKQSRGYFKTVSRLVGRDLTEATLFSLPQDQAIQTNTVKEVISKKTAVLGNILFKHWQREKDSSGALIIKNLAPYSQMLNTTNNELKIYFLALGGYTYPNVIKEEDGGIILTQEQLFKIEFKYSKETVDKYGDNAKIGTTLLQFIKEAPIGYVKVTPNSGFIATLQGKGLGSILVADRFIKLALDVSDIAYKILTYSASNHPRQKIGEEKLIKHLNMERQLRAHGLPSIRRNIKKGFEELQDKGHIKKWQFIEEERQYDFTYTDTFIKHQDFNPQNNKE
jgi:hypothetical protein